ncbi:MAG: hypothetical protein AABW46_02155 [Nanoarchaeota archaeon]
MAKVKAVFFSLGFFILVLIFFSFAVLISDTFKLSRDRTSELIALEKFHTLDESTQQGFRDIFNITSGIKISKTNTITFTEELPNSNETNFKNNLTNFSNFINLNYPIKLSDDIINNELALWIRPHNIKYYHESFGDDIIKVQHESYNFNKYIVNIITTRTLDSTSCSATGNSNGKLDVSATGASSTSCSSNSPQHVDLFDDSDVLIATVDLTSNILTIDSESSITVTTSINSLDDLNKAVDIYTEEGTLFMNFSDFNFIKNTSIRVV